MCSNSALSEMDAVMTLSAHLSSESRRELGVCSEKGHSRRSADRQMETQRESVIV